MPPFIQKFYLVWVAFTLTGCSDFTATTLKSPLDGAATSMNYPGFFWEKVAGAEKYDIQIATTPTFSSLIVADSIETERYVPVGGLSSGATYYWRVRDVTSAGKRGAWSLPRSLTIRSRRGLRVFSIPANASLFEAREQFQKASINSPAIVEFAPHATYRFNPQDLRGYSWTTQNVHRFIGFWYKKGKTSLLTHHDTEQSSVASQRVVLKSNTSYTFNGSIRFGAIRGSGRGAEYRIKFYNAQGFEVGETGTDALKQSGGGWIDRSASFISPPTAVSAEILCSVHHLTGDIAFDAIELRESGTDDDQMMDGSFESYDLESAFVLRETDHVFVEGNNATLIMTSRAQVMKLQNLKSVQISNLTIDYDPVQHTVCKVDSVNAAARHVEVTIFKGYPDLDHPIFKGVHLSVVVQDPLIPGQLKKNTFSGHYNVTATALGHHRFRLSGLRSGRGMKDFAVGDRLLIDARQNGINVFSGDSLQQVTFVNCMALSGVASTFGIHDSTEINLLGCGTRIAPGRYYSTNADGIHFFNHEIGPWVENCLFEGEGDDGVNFKTHGISVLSKISDNQLSFSGNPGIEAGHQLMIVETAVVATAVEVTVTAVQVMEESVLVTVNADVGDIKAGSTKGSTHVYNRSRATGNFVIRNSVFTKNRARGLSIQTDGLIVGNTIEGVSNAAINITNYLSGGVEGFVAPGTKVLRNKIKDCGFDREAIGEGSGSIDVSVTTVTGALAPYQGQKFLQIKKNTIIDWNGEAINLRNGDSCEVSDNVIKNVNEISFLNAPNYPISVGNTRNSWVYNNVVTDSRSVPSNLRILPESVTPPGSVPSNRPALPGTNSIWLFAPGTSPSPTPQASASPSVQGKELTEHQKENLQLKFTD